MGMTKVAGTELSFGVGTISGMVAQSKTTSSGGELREYRDESGNVFSVYLFDDHEQVSFEGLLKSSDAATLKKKGATITVDSTTYYVTDFQVQFSNNDVAKVSGSARTYPDISGGSGSNS